MSIHKLILLADQLDEGGLVKEAAIIDDYLKIASPKVPMHKCGLKEDSVNMHLELLEGYRKAHKSCQEDYKKAIRSNIEGDSAHHGKLRESLRNGAHNANSIYLHELYIEDVITSKPFSLDKCGQAEEFLSDLFEGGSKQFSQELKRVCQASRSGWVLLNFCTLDKKLYLDICDLHEIGIVAASIPVLALDMYEHAYINDFGLDKDAYVEWYLSKIDWRNFVKRIKNLIRLK